MTPRPKPFEDSTPRELWTDPHISAGMLAAHTDAESDLASPRHEFIARACAWLAERIGLDSSKRVVDFGCGPGFWCQRFAECGAQVTGLDFSNRSLEYARERALEAGLEIDYMECDYLEWQSEERFDLIIMAMYDFCVLAPSTRQALLGKWASLLKPDGRVFFDVQSLVAFDAKRESKASAPQLMGGFWAAGEYEGTHEVILYPEEKVSLDRFEIVEPNRTRIFHNWMQFYDPESLEAEITQAGLEVSAVFGDLVGAPYDPVSSQFAVEVWRSGSS